jgi:hypothetical protein
MSIGSQSFKVDDFSGGITDNHISAPSNKYQKADNFLIVSHKDIGKLITRPGSTVYDEANARPEATRNGDLRFFKNSLYSQHVRKLYYYNSGWTELVGPTSQKPFNSSFASTNRISTSEWNSHLFIATDNYDYINKVYLDGSSTPTLRTAGLPELASTPTCTGTGVGQNYVYRFIYSYTYTVGTVTFKDYGPYVQTGTITNNNDPATTNISITSIPALSNGTTTNWDTASANFKVEIYRTVNNGTVFYKVGSVNNGTTTFTDNISNATAQTNELLYTEGGNKENSLPPFAKFITITGDNGIGWYGNIKSGSEIKANRLQQSKPGDPDSCPGEFYIDLAEDMQGLGSVRGFPIVICDGSAYRIEGFFTATGAGGIKAIKISDSTSCINGNSVVQTLDGLFWWGRDAIYYCDGYKVIKINEEWLDTYETLVNTTTKRSFVYGSYDKKNKRIWWSCQEDDASSDSDKCYILDLNWGISDDMPFTSASGDDYFAPSSHCFDNDGNLHRGDRRGYVLVHDDEVFSDPKIDTAVAASDWEKKAIIYDYRSAAYDFGTTQVRKYVTNIILTCKNRTNLSTQIISNNDDNRKISNLSPIRFRDNLIWGDPVPIWGDEDIVWNFDGLIEEQRKFPAGNLRCEYKQIQLTNGFVAIVSSDSLGVGDVNSTSKTLTLTTAGLEFPTDMVDYYVAFEDDGYVNEFLITARTSTTVTYQDSLNLSTTASGSEWVIRGYPKDEIINILSYNLDYTPLSQTQNTYKAAGTGEVGSGS